MGCVNYLSPVMDADRREAETERAVEMLRDHVDEFDAIAVRGLSGLLLGLPLHAALKKQLIIVRKGDEGAHSSNRLETTYNPYERYGVQRVLVVDDLVASGETLREIAHELSRSRRYNSHAPKFKVVGVYLYYQSATQDWWYTRVARDVAMTEYVNVVWVGSTPDEDEPGFRTTWEKENVANTPAASGGTGVNAHGRDESDEDGSGDPVSSTRTPEGVGGVRRDERGLGGQDGSAVLVDLEWPSINDAGYRIDGAFVLRELPRVATGCYFEWPPGFEIPLADLGEWKYEEGGQDGANGDTAGKLQRSAVENVGVDRGSERDPEASANG